MTNHFQFTVTNNQNN